MLPAQNPYSDRPYIICHMAVTIDGKVTGNGFYKQDVSEYFTISDQFGADAFCCGKNTFMEAYGKDLDLSNYKNKNKNGLKDFIIKEDSKKFLICFDRKGSVNWKFNKLQPGPFTAKGFEYAHIVIVLTEKANEDYLAYLQDKKISYIIAGKEDTDLKLALKKIKELLGVNFLLLEGGSLINGSFQREKLVDELSLLSVPIIEEKNSKPLFYDSVFEEFELKDVKKIKNNYIWITYKKK